ncbi:hypothetical protein ACFLRN_02780 [Thermoproteota archaeon]
MDEHVIRRLLYLKALLMHGNKHTEEDNAMDAVLAILHFDNTVEMLMNIILEYFGAPYKYERNFNTLTESTVKAVKKENETIDANKLLKLREISNLHHARNAIQHKGIIPDVGEVRRYAILTQNLVEEVTSKLFGLRFSDISLGELIKDNDVRELFITADIAFGKADYNKATIHAVAAFELAKNNEQFLMHGSGLIIGKLLSSGKSKKEIEGYLHILTEELEILKLRLDYKKYQKYRDISRNLTPFSRFSQNTIVAEIGKNVNEKLEKMGLSHLKDCARFCLDFSIESILRWESVSRTGWFPPIEEINPTN